MGSESGPRGGVGGHRRLVAVTWTTRFHTLTSSIPKVGVLHVGAHDGRELAAYTHFPRVVLVEPNPTRAAGLRGLGVDVIEAAVTTRPGPVTLWVTDRDEGSSILEPLTTYRTVGGVTVPTVRLDDILDVNVLVVDVQGAECEVLDSGDLDRFDLVVVEVSESVRYQDGATRQDVESRFDGWVLEAEFPHAANPGVSDLVFRR